jgi:hypothetical protein
MPIKLIQDYYGQAGIADYKEYPNGTGEYTVDIQMTIFIGFWKSRCKIQAGLMACKNQKVGELMTTPGKRDPSCPISFYTNQSGILQKA